MYNNFYQQPQQNRIQYVNGMKSAEMYNMMPNSEAILMDSNRPAFYLKSTDAAGSATIREFEFKEIVHEDPAVKMDEMQERIKKLEYTIACMKGEANESNSSRQQKWDDSEI